MFFLIYSSEIEIKDINNKLAAAHLVFVSAETDLAIIKVDVETFEIDFSDEGESFFDYNIYIRECWLKIQSCKDEENPGVLAQTIWKNRKFMKSVNGVGNSKNLYLHDL